MTPATGWAIAPHSGVPHGAVFEVAPDQDLSGGAVLILNMAQHYGSDHTIGRFAISVTTSARPVRPPPAQCRRRSSARFAVPAGERTEEDEARIHAHFIAAQPDLAEKIRLGAAQDLAWALANSPAFLFNR